MTKQDAYRIVYNDILNSHDEVFVGKYNPNEIDVENMFGVLSVLQHIAYNVSEQDGLELTDLFIRNMIISENK